jgi:hypothetical protein
LAEDIRIKTGAKTNRKTRRLIQRLGMAGWGHLTFFWMEASHERPDGILHGWTVDDVELAAEWTGEPGKFVEALLNIGFLEKTDDGIFVIHDWPEHQPFIAEEPVRRAQAARAARSRWCKSCKSANSGGPPCEEHAVSMQTAMRFPKSAMPPPTLLPSNHPSNQPTEVRDPENPPVGVVSPAQVVELWNSTVDKKLPHVRELTPKREKHLRARLRPDRDLRWWSTLFARVLASSFLTGAGDRDWRADFDFVIRSEDVVARILEGSYEGGGKGQRPKAHYDNRYRRGGPS